MKTNQQLVDKLNKIEEQRKRIMNQLVVRGCPIYIDNGTIKILEKGEKNET